RRIANRCAHGCDRAWRWEHDFRCRRCAQDDGEDRLRDKQSHQGLPARSALHDDCCELGVHEFLLHPRLLTSHANAGVEEERFQNERVARQDSGPRRDLLSLGIRQVYESRQRRAGEVTIPPIMSSKILLSIILFSMIPLLAVAGSPAATQNDKAVITLSRADGQRWAIAIHGGAGTIPKTLPEDRKKQYLHSLTEALKLGQGV